MGINDAIFPIIPNRHDLLSDDFAGITDPNKAPSESVVYS